MTFLQNDQRLYSSTLFLSLLAHVALFSIGLMRWDTVIPKRTVEIDLTHATRIGGLPSQKKAGRPALANKPTPADWVIPKKGSADATTAPTISPSNEVESKPSATIAGLANEGGTGEGLGGEFTDGYAELNQVSRYPKLLNLGELQVNLQKFYPEYERLKRNEGRVTLDLRIDSDGKVTSSEIIKSSGPAFSEAAQKVAKLLKYKPAMVGRNKVGVKLRQTVEFKLENL